MGETVEHGLVLDGTAYDFTDFISEHPGGRWAIEKSRGRDVTHLFQSYHGELTPPIRARIARYAIQGPVLSRYRFDPLLVGAQRAIARAAGAPGIRAMKTPPWGVAYHVAFAMAYVYQIISWFRRPTIPGGILLGTLAWMCTGLLQHEGSHNAVSRLAWVNHMARLSAIPWASPVLWFSRHTIQHHSDTNTRSDPDFYKASLEFPRHHRDIAWRPVHRLQTGIVLLYGFVFSIKHAFGKGPKSIARLESGWKESLLGVLCTTLWIVRHYQLYGNIWMALCPHAVFGMLFIVLTQINHIHEDAASKVLMDNAPPLDFMRHQISSCVDYAHASLFWSAVCVFSNYQTYHHLFPGVSHFHWCNPKVRSAASTYLRANGMTPPDGSKTFCRVFQEHWNYRLKLSFGKHSRKD